MAQIGGGCVVAECHDAVVHCRADGARGLGLVPQARFFKGLMFFCCVGRLESAAHLGPFAYPLIGFYHPAILRTGCLEFGGQMGRDIFHRCVVIHEVHRCFRYLQPKLTLAGAVGKFPVAGVIGHYIRAGAYVNIPPLLSHLLHAGVA